jgi:hypothetical protein
MITQGFGTRDYLIPTRGLGEHFPSIEFYVLEKSENQEFLIIESMNSGVLELESAHEKNIVIVGENI